MELLIMLIDFFTLPLQFMAWIWTEFGAGFALLVWFILVLLVAIPIIALFFFI